MDPIRVFVGVNSAPTVEERAELAVRELARLGAFERSRIVVISATLRGYVNPIIPDAVEHFSGGDCACVVIQYYDKRTMLMPAKVPIAARTHRELLRQLVRHRGDAEVMVYGESLGAWASQNVFRSGGTAALDALGVSRALWIGTPYFSLLRRDFERGKLPIDERVAMVRATDLVEEDPPDAERARFVFLHRMTDPVVLFPGLELFWRRPEWMPSSEWRPGITFVQTLIDLDQRHQLDLGAAAGARARLPARGTARSAARLRPSRRPARGGGPDRRRAGRPGSRQWSPLARGPPPLYCPTLTKRSDSAPRTS